MNYLIIFNFILLIIIIIIFLIILFKKRENFIGTTTDTAKIYEITMLGGLEGNQYTNLTFGNEKIIIIRQNSQFKVEGNIPNCRLLIIGGGGAGASFGGSGGGAGAFLSLRNRTLAEGNYSVIIGNGGFNGSSGLDTTITLNNNLVYVAKGGGAGESQGGSNGGGDFNSSSSPLTQNIPEGRYGNSGGTNHSYSRVERLGRTSRRTTWKFGGGGGGAGSGGRTANYNGGKGGRGGDGAISDITNSRIYYAGGGGGGSSNDRYRGSGGSNIGGNGGDTYTFATSGAPNTGSGGGGGGGAGYIDGGSGGSGIVIIRYTPVNIPVPPSVGRTSSEVDLNISPPELVGLNVNDIPESYFGEVSQITEANNLYSQSGLTGIRNISDNKNYAVSFSSYVDLETSPFQLFNFDYTKSGNNFGGFFRARRYNPTTGDFIITDTTNRININIIRIINNVETTYNNLTLTDTNGNLLTGIIEFKGEFIKIKCPNSIIVVGYHFIANLAFENQGPGAWVLLARNDNGDNTNPYKLIDISELDNTNEFVRNTWEIYYNKQQMKTCYISSNRGIYNEYLFIFPKLASTDLQNNVNYGHQLIFREIKLYELSNEN